jgi:hypothetical protein
MLIVRKTTAAAHPVGVGPVAICRPKVAEYGNLGL